jgi:hypothetical protein
VRQFWHWNCELDYKPDNFRQISHIGQKVVLESQQDRNLSHFHYSGKASFSLFGTFRQPIADL